MASDSRARLEMSTSHENNANYYSAEQLALEQTLSSQDLNFLDNDVNQRNLVENPTNPNDKTAEQLALDEPLSSQDWNVLDEGCLNPQNPNENFGNTEDNTVQHRASDQPSNSPELDFSFDNITGTNRIDEDDENSSSNDVPNLKESTDPPGEKKQPISLRDVSNALSNLSILDEDSSESIRLNHVWPVTSGINATNDSTTSLENTITNTEETKTVLSIEELSNFSNEKTWKQLDEAGTYIIFAFTVKCNRMNRYVAILAQKENVEGKRVYYLKGSYNECFRGFYSRPDLLKKENYRITETNRLSIFHLDSGPFAEFKISGTELNDFVFYTDPWNDYKRIFGINEEDSPDLLSQDSQQIVDEADNGANLTQPESQPDDFNGHSAEIKSIDSGILPEELSSFSKDKTWRDLDVNDTYKIYGFAVKFVNQTPRVAILARKETENGRKVYHLKGEYKDRFVHFFNNFEMLARENYVITNHGQLDIIHRAAGEALAKFKTNGTVTVPGTKYPRLEKFKFYTDSWYKYEMFFGMMKEKLLDLFLWDNWMDRNLDEVGEYRVHAFGVGTVQRTAGSIGVLASKKNSDRKLVYVIRGDPKKEFQNRFDSWKSLENQDYSVIKRNNWNIMYLTSKTPLAKFETDGISTERGKSFPKIVHLHFLNEYHLPDEDLIFGETKETLSNLFKSENWKRLDETAKYKVYAFSVFEGRNSSDVVLLARKKSTDFKDVFHIEGNSADEFKYLFNARTEALSGYKVVKFYGMEIMISDNYRFFAQFKTNGIDSEGRGFPKIENLKFARPNSN